MTTMWSMKIRARSARKNIKIETKTKRLLKRIKTNLICSWRIEAAKKRKRNENDIEDTIRYRNMCDQIMTPKYWLECKTNATNETEKQTTKSADNLLVSIEMSGRGEQIAIVIFSNDFLTKRNEKDSSFYHASHSRSTPFDFIEFRKQ